MARRRAADVAVAVGLAALALLLYHQAAGFWWAHDDFVQVAFAADHRVAEYAFDPAVWGRLPIRMLTPLLIASYDLDLALFGARPRPFHVHQLVALGLAAAALYALLRLWMSRPWAAAGASIFLVGPPVVGLAALLMVRHYVEGLLLALLAGIAFVVAVRRRSVGTAVASAALALAAMLAKEVFVPLVLLLPMVPVGAARERWRLAVPHAAALVLYVLYRRWLLGTLAGGYGMAVPPDEVPRVVATLPLRLLAAMAGGSALGWLAVALGGAAAGYLALRGRRAAALLATAAVAAVGPLLAVAAEMAPRYATVAWAGLAVACPAAGSLLARRGPAARRLAAVAAAAVLVAAFAANRAAWAETVRTMRRIGAEDRAMLTLGPRDLLDHPRELPAALDSLPAFAARFYGRPTTAGRFSDDLFLCLGGARGKRVWSWDAGSERLIEASERVAARGRRHCAAIARHAPLSVRLEPSQEALWWRLGPRRDGEYRLLLDDGVRSFAVPAAGGYRLQRGGELRLRVRYQAPDGWVTYSPELAVELGSGRVVRWRRGGRE